MNSFPDNLTFKKISTLYQSKNYLVHAYVNTTLKLTFTVLDKVHLKDKFIKPKLL